jgi:uncharacterized protein (DUF2252 family)
MVKLKYKAMSGNPFRFFRGTCHIFYEDLAKVETFPVSPPAWLCGDLHLENFGSFRGNNRMEYFDLNDFDEAILGPALWEVARVITSIYVAFDLLGLKKTDIDELAKLFLEKYTATLKYGKSIYIDPRTATGLVRGFLKSANLINEKALLGKMAIIKDDHYSIKINNQTHFKLEKKLKKELLLLIKHWIKKTNTWPDNYRVLDAAFRVAGTGSVGLKRYMFLLQNKTDKYKFLFLEMKAAARSSVLPYIKISQPVWPSEAERVITAKKRMQNVSPALLSTINFQEQDYVIQEMQPIADKIGFEIMPGNKKGVVTILLDMAILTASAQLRSGGIQGSATIDELTSFAGNNGWHKPLLDYAKKYSTQVKSDYQQFAADFKKSPSG